MTIKSNPYDGEACYIFSARYESGHASCSCVINKSDVIEAMDYIALDDVDEMCVVFISDGAALDVTGEFARKYLEIAYLHTGEPLPKCLEPYA